MLNYIIGKVVMQESNYIVLENNQIGFTIFVANPFSFELNKEAQVYLYNQVKEDEYSLYGFKNIEERNLFLKLINVKGLGPKMTLPMLATGSVAGIVDAIERENLLYLKKFPKVGDKVAKQIILDLKGKMNMSVGEIENSNNTTEELTEVLLGLGYKMPDIKKVLPHVNTELEIGNQVKEALKLMMK